MTEKEIYKNGVALLEEWEDVNYCEHTFKFKDEWLTDKEVVDLLSQLNDENEQLIMEKERYKTLYRIAREQIYDRILTIKNFIEDCSDDNVKKALKKLLCTDVQRYDVSAKNSALIDENEQLKKEYQKLKHRHSLLHDECLDLECERDSLKKDVNSLEEENEQLKQRLNDLKHEIHHLKHEQKCLIKDITFLTAPQAKQLIKENEELKQTIKTICKDYEVSHGMDIRNAEWFTAW